MPTSSSSRKTSLNNTEQAAPHDNYNCLFGVCKINICNDDYYCDSFLGIMLTEIRDTIRVSFDPRYPWIPWSKDPRFQLSEKEDPRFLGSKVYFAGTRQGSKVILGEATRCIVASKRRDQYPRCLQCNEFEWRGCISEACSC